MNKKGLLYLQWQTKAVQFYVSARLLFNNEQFFTSAFCGIHAIETLMKGTLQYWKNDFNPKNAGHRIEEMARLLNREVSEAQGITVPDRFYEYEDTILVQDIQILKKLLLLVIFFYMI